MLPHEVARESQLLETQELKLECGVQDQFASAYGGVNFMEVEYPNARVFPVPLEPSVRCELEDRFLLVYTGKSHFSSGMHQKVINEAAQHAADFDDAHPSGHRRQGSAPDRRPRPLRRRDERQLGGAEEPPPRHHDRTRSRSCTRPCSQAGAKGFKANGAGGGGTVTVLAGRNGYHLVKRAVEAVGMLVLPALIDTTGLQVWEVD